MTLSYCAASLEGGRLSENWNPLLDASAGGVRGPVRRGEETPFAG